MACGRNLWVEERLLLLMAVRGKEVVGVPEGHRSMAKVVDAIRCLVRAMSGRSPARMFETPRPKNGENIR